MRLLNCNIALLYHVYFAYLYRAENSNLPHTLATLEVSQYFANYFVNEARKSMHDFKSETEVLENVIQNWPAVLTAKDGSNFFQAYLFNGRNN